MEILLILLILALLFVGGFVLRLLGLALGLVIAVVLGAGVLVFVVLLGLLT